MSLNQMLKLVMEDGVEVDCCSFVVWIQEQDVNSENHFSSSCENQTDTTVVKVKNNFILIWCHSGCLATKMH